MLTWVSQLWKKHWNSDSHLVFIYFNESPLKMTKSAFYLILKALLEIFLFFDYVEKRLDKKAKVISKLIESKTGQQIISIYILPLS